MNNCGRRRRRIMHADVVIVLRMSSSIQTRDGEDPAFWVLMSVGTHNCWSLNIRSEANKTPKTTMKQSFVLSLLATSTSAFAPVNQQSGASTTGIQAFEGEIGAQPPLGFFDPLGLLADADEDRFNRLRYVEIKHGRISMLAVLGHIVTTGGVRLPGAIDLEGTSFASIPTGIAALSKVPDAGLLQIFLFVGFLELSVMKDVTGDGEFVGDFRNNYIDFGWDALSPEEQERKRGIELNNGRAAMMGILGLMVHEMLPTHDPYMINALVGYPIDFNAGF